MSEGFQADVNTMMFFFRVCRRYKIDTAQERISLLRRLVTRNNVKYIPHPEQYLNGHNVIDTRQGENDGNI